jgi:hypothetical protein
MAYNPTTFEHQKQNDFVRHSCLFCHCSFISQRKDNRHFCNAECEQEYEETGPVEYPCIDFDAEDNM